MIGLDLIYIWRILSMAGIMIALIITFAFGLACIFGKVAWRDAIVDPWAKAERRAAKKKEKEELRARRAFYK